MTTEIPAYVIKQNYNKKNIKKTETINKKYLNYLVRRPEILEKYKSVEIKGQYHRKNYNIQTVLKKICYSCKKSDTYDTFYNQAKSSNFKGRFFVDGSLGLQMLSKEIRHCLAVGIYTDYDFKNCHPTLLLQLCQKNKWSCQYLNHYVENREECLNEMMEITKYNYGECKTQILIMLNSGVVKLNNAIIEQSSTTNEPLQLKWLFNLKDELIIIRNKLCKAYPEFHELAEKKNKISNKNNIEGSAFNSLICHIENQCLLAFEEFLQNNNFKPDVLCFDGLMVQSDDDLTEDILRKAEDYIYERTDFKLEIAEKEFENIIDIDEEDCLTIDEVDTYEYLKNEFEKCHFKLVYPPCLIKVKPNGDLQYFNDNQFTHVYQNKYYKAIVVDKQDNKRIVNKKFLRNSNIATGEYGGWLNDPNIRCYDAIDFYPPPQVCPINTYNSWNGFEIERTTDEIVVEDYSKDEDMKVWFDFMETFIPNENARNYIITFFAFIIQYPGLKNKVAILMKGEYGAGKNACLDVLVKMIGKNLIFQTPDIEKDIFSRFSIAVENKIVNILDELSGKHTYKLIEQIKDMITNETAQVERKGLPMQTVKDNRKFFETTNNDNCVPIDENDRRQAIIETSDYYCKNTEFFNMFFKRVICNPTTLRKIFQYLRDFKVDNKSVEYYDFVNNRPASELRSDMIEHNLQIELKFLRWYIQQRDVYVKDYIKLPVDALYERYLEFERNYNLENFKINKLGFSQKFSRILKNNKIDGISKPDIRSAYSFYNIYPEKIINWFITHKHLDISPKQGLLIMRET